MKTKKTTRLNLQFTIYNLQFVFAFLFSLFTLHSSLAQTWQWARSGTGNINSNGLTKARAVATDRWGNVCMGGIFYGTYITFAPYLLTSDAGYGDGYTVKYDPNGNVLWAKSLRALGGSTYIDFMSTDIQGNVYIAGAYGYPNMIFGKDTLLPLTNNGDENFFIAKYNASGNELWAICPTTINKRASFGVPLIGFAGDSAGNLFLSGYYGAKSDSIAIFGKDTLISDGTNYIAKYDSSGNVLWVKNVQVKSIFAMDKSDNLYLAGYFSGPYIIFGKDTVYDTIKAGSYFCLFKYDANGNPVWAKSYGENMSPLGITTDRDRNIYMTGELQGPGTFRFGADSFPLYRGNVFLTKCDSAGNGLWARIIGGDGNLWAENQGNSVAVAPDNTIYITGTVGEPYNIAGSDTIYNKGVSDILVAAYSPSGVLLWTNNIGWNEHSNEGTACNTDRAGNIYVGGSYAFDTLAFGTDTIMSPYESAFLAKLAGYPAGVTELKVESGEWKVYPNPFRNSTTVLLNNSGKYYIELDDITGRKLQEFMFTGKEYEMNVQGLAAGLYFLRAFDSEKNVIGITKIVIE